MKLYTITHKTVIVIVAENEEEALDMAYKQEFKAIDYIDFKCSSIIKEDK